MELTDVVLRDGLQDEPGVVSTSDKVEVARALLAAGLRVLEVASFVSPSKVPQLADAEDVLAALPRPADVRWCGIALNARGVRRAARTRLDELRIVVSAGAGHSRANAGRETGDALAEFADALSSFPGHVVGAVSTAFHCPYDGPVPLARLLSVVRGFREMGVREISLADTLGTASTDQVLRSVHAVREEFPDAVLSLHLHDAHGQALSTVDAAIAAGVSRFDSALGGLGGCPFAPGASGNLATEALVEHLHRRGVETGVSEAALSAARERLATALRA